MRRVVALTQRVMDLPDRGERRDALDQQWAVLLEAAGFVPVAIPNLLEDPAGFLEQLDPSLVILTGGNDLSHLPGAVNPAPERDRLETRLLDLAATNGLPVLGVCRGLQMMVVHAGGKLEPVAGHVARPHPIRVVAPGPWPLYDGREVNSFHDWGIAAGQLGHTLVPLATAPDDTIEAACHPELPMVGVMWHPERAPNDQSDIELIHALVARTPQ